MSDRKLLYLMGLLLLVTLVTVASKAEDCGSNVLNVADLKAVVTETRSNTLVSLSVERPYIMVTKAQKEFYDWNGYLPAEGGSK